ncbi:MAG TPA: DUF1499 domain-containing protein [Roseiarcus sp.]|nr:DUF1499 domain-containing protein [Roseiarcus sp.]
MRPLTVEEPVAAAARWSRRLAVFAAAIALVAVALARIRAADPPAALTVFAAALVIAAIAMVLAASAAGTIWRDGLKGAGQAAFGFFLAAALMAYPAYLAVLAFVLPPINQVSTDPASPPPFMFSTKARKARAGFEPPPLGERTQAAQRAAYPDLETVKVEMDSSEAYRLALGAASDLGWRIVDAEPPNLAGDGSALIEATDRSLFFGLVRDIAIRIRPGATRTAIDVRSASRLGRHDFGANAERVRRFIEAVKEESREG